MSKTAADNLLQSRTDMAALHPALHQGKPGDYFDECRALREAIKQELVAAFGINHDLYLLGNATAGLMACVTGLVLEGFTLDLEGLTDPAYARLRRNVESVDSVRLATFRTHIDPASGRVTLPVSGAGLWLLIFDASQSFAAIRHHGDAFRADILFCGLHQNAGISTGLGLLAIRKGLAHGGLRHIAAIAESGSNSLFVLEEALARCRSAGEEGLFNKLVFRADPDLHRRFERLKIRVLTPQMAQLPFLCFAGFPPEPMARLCVEAGLSLKLYPKEGKFRISGHIPGHKDDPPVDRTGLLLGILEALDNETTVGD